MAVSDRREKLAYFPRFLKAFFPSQIEESHTLSQY